MTNVDFDVAQLEQICKKQSISALDTQLVSQKISNYFNVHGRDQAFRKILATLTSRFSDLIEHCEQVSGVEFADQFFLFTYTLSENYDNSQREIFENIAVPFQNWVHKKWGATKNVFEFNITNQTDTVLIITRHCVTQGMYAPGKSIYSITEALLMAGRTVEIICLGSLGQDFLLLEKKFKSFKVIKLVGSDLNSFIISTLDIIRLTRPKCIISEMEFGIGGLLGILSQNIPTYYFAQGYYNLPWYDKLLISDGHRENNVSLREESLIFYHPFLSQKLLAPNPNEAAIEQAKQQLQISDNDIVVSSFGRMEKFSLAFLDDCIAMLEANPRVKLILAGSNDAKIVLEKLEKYTAIKRAFVLPPSDTHTLGYLTTFGIDSHPNPAGYAVLELLAKGKPVFSRDREELRNWKKQRQTEFLYNDQKQLNKFITKLTSSHEAMEQGKESALKIVNKFGLSQAQEFITAVSL